MPGQSALLWVKMIPCLWHRGINTLSLFTRMFLLHDAMLNAVYAVVVCLCVCLSITLRYCIKTAKLRFTQIMLHDRSRTLVYTDNMYTKYEVSMFTHYEDMKGDEKCKNWGGLGVRVHPRSLKKSPFDREHMTSYSTLIETMRLSCTVFEL